MSQKSDKPRGVFDDFSLTAVVASALTAATSFLLTSRIGLAGSLIGAMIAAVISTASTQVYKGMLTASADRIREVTEPAAPLGYHAASAPAAGHEAARKVGRFAVRLAVFAACVSLAAVLASAAVIAFATRGAGLGPTTWETVTATEEATDDATAADDKADEETGALVSEDTSDAETADGTGTYSGTSTEDASNVGQTASGQGAANAAASASVEEEPTGQEQPLTEQGLQEVEAGGSSDGAE